MEQTFEKYVKNFDMNDQDINHKYYHSYRVMEKSVYLAKSLNLNQEDSYLAKLIGLYHDIGRFEQDKKFDSFLDAKTFDHGDYGAKILIEDNLIKDIPVSEKYYKIIEKAVKNHNKYKIEDGLTKQELLHAKLIRDADKLDIIYAAGANLLTKKALDLENTKLSIRKVIEDQFYSKKTIKRSTIIGLLNPSEKIISFLALIFDLNFNESKQYLLNNNLIENLYNKILNKEEYKEYFDFIMNYLKEE